MGKNNNLVQYHIKSERVAIILKVPLVKKICHSLFYWSFQACLTGVPRSAKFMITFGRALYSHKKKYSCKLRSESLFYDCTGCSNTNFIQNSLFTTTWNLTWVFSSILINKSKKNRNANRFYHKTSSVFPSKFSRFLWNWQVFGWYQLIWVFPRPLEQRIWAPYDW